MNSHRARLPFLVTYLVGLVRQLSDKGGPLSTGLPRGGFRRESLRGVEDLGEHAARALPRRGRSREQWNGKWRERLGAFGFLGHVNRP